MDSSSKTTVALFDDHQMFREGLASLLVQERFSIVAQADNGKEGLKLLKELNPQIAIVDINMPGLTGFEILAAVRHGKLDTKVVLLTSSESPADAARAVEGHTNAYVLKEDAFDELIDAINHTLVGKEYISPGIASALVRWQGKRCDRVMALSPREQQVVGRIGEGLTNKEVASDLGISLTTVRTHRANAMAKLDLHTTGEIVRYALEAGLSRD